MYFVHDYAVECYDWNDVTCTTQYSKKFPSVISRKNIFGVQFHPEKSQKSGSCNNDQFCSGWFGLMSFVRLIPTLSLKDGRIIKTKRFDTYRDIGDPKTTARFLTLRMLMS